MIFNESKKSVIAQAHKTCKNSFCKAIGLMFAFRPKALVFEFTKPKIVPLHMMFVFFSIDVLFLDESGVVVELKERLRPWTFFHPHKMAKTVVELPAGTVLTSDTALGDTINFK
ncbi:DUF192 domain-containing protein [Candidatus Woesearchaeota archaeon]|nr:DUF192 domain-containing protein [Candidatus Woesearchaeota archaeon]